MSKTTRLIEYYRQMALRENSGEASGNMEQEEWMIREHERLESLYLRERMAFQSGIGYIAGVDEVGRGPMAGPVVAAAVIMERFTLLPGLDDSKKLNESLREEISRAVKEKALSFSLGIAHREEIDKHNILQASLLAMHRAIQGLERKPELVLVDGNKKIPGLEIPQETVVGGDGKVFSIAAASVVAKVARDKMMADYDLQYPGYNFGLHKGYCTELHRKALENLGPSPIHRRSFKPVRDILCRVEQVSFL